MCLGPFVFFIDLNENRAPAAVMETCYTTISLLKTTDRALQEGAGYLLLPSLSPSWYLLLSPLNPMNV